MLTDDKILSNKDEFIKLLLSVNYVGMDKLIEWLENTDFFIAPASSYYHNNFKGGLCDHSLNVYKMALAISDAIIPLSTKMSVNGAKMYDQDELVVASLLHDLCKVCIYKPTTKWIKDNRNNQWICYDGYEIDDTEVPLGHGEKSLFFAQQFIRMKLNTIMAIRWHMHSYAQNSVADEFTKYPMIHALKNYPLVNVIMQADSFASFNMEEIFDPKELIK